MIPWREGSIVRKHSALIHKFTDEQGEYTYYAEIGGKLHMIGKSNSAVSMPENIEPCGLYRQTITELVNELYGTGAWEVYKNTVHKGSKHTKFIKHWTSVGKAYK